MVAVVVVVVVVVVVAVVVEVVAAVVVAVVAAVAVVVVAAAVAGCGGGGGGNSCRCRSVKHSRIGSCRNVGIGCVSAGPHQPALLLRHGHLAPQRVLETSHQKQEGLAVVLSPKQNL